MNGSIRLMMLASILVMQCEARVVKDAVVRFTESEVNGVHFSYRRDMVNGVKKEMWSVNGRSVPYEEYEESLLDAEREERRKELKKEVDLREQEDQAILEMQQFHQKARCEIGKRQLQFAIKQVESEFERIAKLKEERLDHYFAFNEQTFESRDELEQLHNQQLPQARDLLQQSYEAYDEKELHMQLVALEDAPTRLQSLYRQTCSNAIESCDDTRTLKGLLELVS